MAKCSIFKTIFEKNDPQHWEVDGLLEYIKAGRWEQRIHQVRLELEPAAKKKLKEFLPSICFSGTFSNRFDNKLIQHSGIVVLDFDHVANLEEKKKEICADEFTYSCFISPSGDGLKVLVKIPPEVENHRDYYRGLMKKYPSLDPTSINVSRVCFVSYDSELYLNKDSKIWEKKGKYNQPEKSKAEAQDTNYIKIQIAVDMIRNSVDGDKHPTLIKASRLMGGYIASGTIEEHEAVRVLEVEINKKNPIDFGAAQKAIRAGIEYGKDFPIYPDNETKSIKKIQDEIIIIEGEPATDVVYLDDVRENIVYSFKNGTSRGESTHFPDIDTAYRMARKEVTVVHGFANHGKSAFVMQMALIKSVKDGHKWGVFSPENYPAHEFYKDLIHSYIGESTEKHHDNQMSESSLNKGMNFIKDHFFFM